LSKKNLKIKLRAIVCILLFNIFKTIEAELLRNKVKAMSRMMKMFKTLREENESVV
jgi:hypothetical protein